MQSDKSKNFCLEQNSMLKINSLLKFSLVALFTKDTCFNLIIRLTHDIGRLSKQAKAFYVSR